MMLLEPLYDSLEDRDDVADELTTELQEHLLETALVIPLGPASETLAHEVARRLGFAVAHLDALPSAGVPRTVIVVAERIRRVRAVDAALAAVLHAGAEKVLIATPLAETATAEQVDDRADVFVCLRRAPMLGRIARWYDRWSMPSQQTHPRRAPRETPMLAAV